MSNERISFSPEQVAALSDAELSAALAEHVMKWTLQVIEQSTAFGQIAIGFYYNETESFICNETSFSPATSLADAARCTEVMMRKGLRFSVELKPHECHVFVLRPEGGQYFVDRIVHCATEPRARAEAALLAAMKGES